MSESSPVPENPTPPPPVTEGQLAAVLPLRDIVVFPHMIVPLFVGREKSVRALEEVMSEEKQILLLTQKNAGEDDPVVRWSLSRSARWPPCCSSSSFPTRPCECWSRARRARA